MEKAVLQLLNALPVKVLHALDQYANVTRPITGLDLFAVIFFLFLYLLTIIYNFLINFQPLEVDIIQAAVPTQHVILILDAETANVFAQATSIINHLHAVTILRLYCLN